MTTDGPGRFATTRWSLVRAAADGTEDVAGRDALAALYTSYWRPVYSYCRRTGLTQTDAEDASQEFHVHLLSGGVLAGADPDRGRFRSYLLTCLRNFLGNRHREGGARKRGGSLSPLSLDVEAAEAFHLAQDTELDPAVLFERAWALTLLDRVLARLREDYERQGRGEVFAVLKPVLTGGRGAVPYSELAETLETSVGAVKVAVHKLRRRYREVLHREIADTVAAPEDVEDEIRALFAALG